MASSGFIDGFLQVFLEFMVGSGTWYTNSWEVKCISYALPDNQSLIMQERPTGKDAFHSKRKILCTMVCFVFFFYTAQGDLQSNNS